MLCLVVSTSPFSERYVTQLQEKKVTYINAQVSNFVDPHTVEFIDPETQEPRRLTARQFVIAVGCRPNLPDIPGAELGALIVLCCV